MRSHIFVTLSIILAMFAFSANAAFISALVVYSSMQPACANAVMACYATGGSTCGATLDLTAPPTIAACNAGFGACQASAAKAASLAALIPFVRTACAQYHSWSARNGVRLAVCVSNLSSRTKL